ncbi:uncharacterized protein VTP21DRAFT_2737 [Calcarisporiella thermophila]|uniref:uncharacterized protein n=1 Tax=Calcarisporiella thermophila TaxID=911321 RepID=UPI00374208BB
MRYLGSRALYKLGHNLSALGPTLFSSHVFRRFPLSSTLQRRIFHNDGYQRFQHNKTPIYQNKRFWLVSGAGGFVGYIYYLNHLETVPFSGRRRFIDITPRQEEAMAIQAYQQIMAQYGRYILPQNHPYTKLVRRVAQRIINVSGLHDLNWEVYVIESKEKNAFVLPGGKIFVFTGLFEITQNEDALAAVLGHECAHQIARHNAEKISRLKIIFIFQLLLSFFFDPSFLFNRLFLEFGLLLPFSRNCEVEADSIGLTLMAQACYDPKEAIKMWERMEKADKSLQVQFISTHPTHKNRIARLSEQLPQAIIKRENSDCISEIDYLNQFNQQIVYW